MSTQDVRENGQTLMGRGDTPQGQTRRMLLSPRRVLVAGVVTALSPALGAVAVAVGADSLGTASNPERIDIISRATAINNFVDVGPTGASPGDIYVLVDDVYFPKAPSTPVGQAVGRCTLIDPG
jgi:hypothetical protein